MTNALANYAVCISSGKLPIKLPTSGTLIIITFSRYIAIIFTLFASFLKADETQPIQVKFATDTNYYPFEYISEDQQIVGFDIDIAKAICKEVKLQCSFKHHNFNGLLLTLQFGRYDAAIAALDITSERLEMVDFTNSYYKTAPVFISQQTANKGFSLEGKFIGVQANTSNQSYLTRNLKENSYIVPYFSSAEALADLKQQKIDAVFADSAVVTHFLSQQDAQSTLAIQRVEESFLSGFSEGYGIAVRKGNAKLKQQLNKGLEIILANGIYSKIFQQYFPQQ